jgi:DNA-3-methyladenine glycosylase II
MASSSRVVAPEEHLSGACPIMKRVIKRVGAYALVPQKKRAPYESLMRAIAHQQLNGRAAETILGRFLALYPNVKFPTPEQVLETQPKRLRAVGFSEAKVRSILDIADKTVAGVVPSGRAIVRMPDDEIIERLTVVRGVGRWTVEMLLIFQLGRPDILPVDDFGVRNGFRYAKKLVEMPKPKELMAYGERWAPHRTAAAWYLWRVADAENKKAAAARDAAKRRAKEKAT